MGLKALNKHKITHIMYIELETVINLTNYVAQRAEQTLVTTLIMYIEIEIVINLTNS